MVLAMRLLVERCWSSRFWLIICLLGSGSGFGVGLKFSHSEVSNGQALQIPDLKQGSQMVEWRWVTGCV